MKNNILLIGKGTIAVNVLNILHRAHALPKVIICDTNDEGVDTWTKSLFKRAKALGYKEGETLFRERRVNSSEFLKKLSKKAKDIDIIFSIQPYAIFHLPFIRLAKKYVINLHMAPLPKLRGMATCSWAFLDGLTEMGVTLHVIEDKGVDNGPILFQKFFKIEKNDNAWKLFNKCVTYGTKLFEEKISVMLSGKLKPKPQNEKDVTYHPMHELDFTQLQVSLDQDLDDAYRFIQSRIFPPMQLPYIIYKKKKIFIEKARKIAKRKKENKIGTIEQIGEKYYLYYQQGAIIIETNKK